MTKKKHTKVVLRTSQFSLKYLQNTAPYQGRQGFGSDLFWPDLKKMVGFRCIPNLDFTGIKYK